MDFPSTRAFMEHLTAWRIPGNTITVFYRGKEIFSFSSGYADLEGGHLMQGNELFNIYSCTKVATVTAALQLLEKGLFTLETPLYDIFPAFRHMLVRGEVFPLRYAESFSDPKPVVPGEVVHLKFNMNDVAHWIKPGHKLMVQIQSSWFPLVNINPQKYLQNIYEAQREDYRKADITIYHQEDLPSAIYLPLK